MCPCQCRWGQFREGVGCASLVSSSCQAQELSSGAELARSLFRRADCLAVAATGVLRFLAKALLSNCSHHVRRCCSPGGCGESAWAVCSGGSARDRLAAVALGTACIAFAVVVFIFFTTWLLAPVRLWEAGQLNDGVVPRWWQRCFLQGLDCVCACSVIPGSVLLRAPAPSLVCVRMLPVHCLFAYLPSTLDTDVVRLPAWALMIDCVPHPALALLSPACRVRRSCRRPFRHSSLPASGCTRSPRRGWCFSLWGSLPSSGSRSGALGHRAGTTQLGPAVLDRHLVVHQQLDQKGIPSPRPR